MRNRSSPEYLTSLTSTVIKEYLNGASADSIGRKHRVDGETIRKILRTNGVVIRRYRSESQKFVIEESFFNEIKDERRAYFLGLIFADGNIVKDRPRMTISLQKRDGYVLRELSKALAFGKDLTKPFRLGKFEGLKLGITSGIMIRGLAEHGCHPVKSMTIRLPALDKEMMPHFLRGYFDGDGCFTNVAGRKKTNRRGIFKIVSNKMFCTDMQKYLFDNLGLYYGVYTPSKNQKVGALQSGNDNNLRIIYHYMYDHATLFLTRKKEKIEQYLTLKT